MENSFIGVLITFGVISLFIIGLTTFVTEFPVDQGFSFTKTDNQTFVTLNSINHPNITDLENSLETGFGEWDIEVGYMGSNTQKATKATASSYISQVTDNLGILIKEVFSSTDGDHPMIYAFGVFLTLLGIFLTLIIIKFLRTGS